MRDDSDIRFKILDHLDKKGNATEEVICNEFLASLHPDLGTIKRTLIELLDAGYIHESNVNWATHREITSVVNFINTVGDANKSSARLLDKNAIKSIRLYLTLEGKKFLIECDNLRHTTWTIRNEWWLKILYLVIGAALTTSGYYLNSILTKSKDCPQQEQQSTLSPNTALPKAAIHTTLTDSLPISDTTTKKK